MNIMNKVTLRNLKQNKTRTIVTIIGVILSTAMITAVTTFASSIQNFLLEYAISQHGDWHARIDMSNSENLEEIIDDKAFEQVSFVKSDGYAILEEGVNEYKPYLHILELDNNAMDILPIYLTEGRFPESPNEVVLSDHISYNGGVTYELGDTLTLEVGERTLDGYLLNQDNPYNHENDGVAEAFQVSRRRSFTVVGFCDRLSFGIEDFSAPGYSIFTTLDTDFIGATDKGDLDLSIYANLKKPKEVYELEKEYYKNYQIDDFAFNNKVLIYEGVSMITGYNIVLNGLIAIVAGLIMIGSIALIYNSFSISISERSKQFGLLSSVGATKKQMMNSVLSEALFIAIIGIPIGIISGATGIGITLYLLRDNFASMLGEDIPVELSLHVSVPSIIGAIILSLITILISAYIPARRSKKVSTLDSIRQTPDVKLTSRNVKTSKLTRKIFGIEGDLALKNLKRNKKKYRSTVFSLFISVFLFISASAVSMYLTDSVANAFQIDNYDLKFDVYGESELASKYDKVYNDIMDLDTITDTSKVKFNYWMTFIEKDQVESTYYSSISETWRESYGDKVPVEVELYSIDHESFTRFLKEIDVSKERFEKSNVPRGIIIDKQHYFDNEEGRYRNSNIFKNKNERNFVIEREIYYGDSEETDTISIPIEVGAFAETSPLGVSKFAYEGRLILVLDEESIKNHIINKTDYKTSDIFYGGYTMYFASNSPNDSESEIEKILDEAGIEYEDWRLYNTHEEVNNKRNVITIINVFAYGFIILMSLITIANVFNTITTNINLRRREFAMLKSVGMTSKGFNKMLNFECVFYGVKGLLYGLPASILVTYLIYRTFEQGVETSFYLPVKSIIISILSVFIVVFVSMMYSMRKVREENIVDALKNENI